LARYNDDGTLDTDFAPGGQLDTNLASFQTLLIDNVNRILVGGNSFTTSSTGADFLVARYITQGLSVTVLNLPPQIDSFDAPTTGVEGTDFDLEVTASDPAGVADPLTYSWNITLNGNPYQLAGGSDVTVTPVDNGSYVATVTVDDGDGGIVSSSRTITVSNVAPTGTFNAPTSVNEGNAIVLSITDPFDPSDTDTTVGFEYAFDFGSGFGAFSTSNSASFTPLDDAVLTVMGKIRDKDGAETEYTATVTVSNVAPTVVLDPVANIDENGTATLSGSYTDPGTLDEHEAVVGWDDLNNATDSTFALSAIAALMVGDTINSTTDSAVLTVTGLTADTVSFSAEHQYLDDGAAPGNNTASDSSTITVTVTDDDASDLITFAFSGTVNDVDFDTGTPAEFAVGDAFSGSYTFDSTDADSNVSPNNGYYLSSIATLSFSAGTYSGSFANGNILVRDDVPVQDLYRVETQSTALPGPSVLGLPLDSFTLEINDFTGTVFSSDVLLLVPPDLTDFQSTTLELLFFDPFGGDFGQVRATLDSLTLASPANAGVGAATTQVTVNNIAPAFDAGGAGPDETLNPPVAGAFSRTGITFNDPGTLDVHTVEVDWDGNGSYDQTINVPLGDRDFDLSHTFLTEGSFTVAVRLTDDDLGGVIDSFVVEVILNQAPEADAGGPYVVDEGESLILNGSGSTDPDSTNPPDNNNDIVTYEWDLDYNGFTFDVDFSTTSPVDTAAAFPDNFAVRDIALRVTDSHGETDIATTTLTVDNVAPTGTFNAPTSVNEGDAIELSITDPFDPLTSAPASGRSAPAARLASQQRMMPC
jgi:hypothetical protein